MNFNDIKAKESRDNGTIFTVKKIGSSEEAQGRKVE